MDKKRQMIADVYAKSLVEFALEKNQVALIYQDVQAIATVLEDKAIQNFLTSKAVSTTAKTEVVRLFQESSSDYLKNFLEIILQNQRQSFLALIMKEALQLLSLKTQTFDIKVTSAVALSEPQKERLTALAEKKFALTKREVTETIDPTVIGGFIIEANNKVIDTSIRKQLHDLKMNLK